MGRMADMIEADLDGVDPREMSEHFRAVASLTQRQLSGMLGWVQQQQDAQVYEVAYTLDHYGLKAARASLDGRCDWCATDSGQCDLDDCQCECHAP